MTTKQAPTVPWRSRIVGSGEEAPDQLVANPLNWRTHPGPSATHSVVRSPRSVVRDDGEQIRLFARELGLSPSARAGLRVEPEHGFGSIDHDLGLPPRLRAIADGR